MYSRLGVWLGAALLAAGTLVLSAQLRPSAHIYDLAIRWWPVTIIAVGVVGVARLNVTWVAVGSPWILRWGGKGNVTRMVAS